MKNVSKAELTKLFSSPDGKKPAFYRMAELYFPSQAQMQETLNSPEGKAAIDDLPKFATGGVTMIVGNATEMLQPRG